ncbi:MAG: PKD domain-containing protein [Candidatus Thermoplasmatota archaeon]|nr:PKD domain-containing protein [Candidatus Thermoplasmatota archaeon]
MKKRGVGITLLVVILFLFLSVGNYKGICNAFPTGNILFVDSTWVPDEENNKYNCIQAAINNAHNGDIVYVFDGTYNENLFIYKSIQLIGESNVMLNGIGNSNAIYIITNDVLVTNFTITNGALSGIQIDGSLGGCNAMVKNCRISGNGKQGILLHNTNSNKLINCSIENNPTGIKGEHSYNNTVLNSEIYGGEWGIVFDNCNNSSVEYSLLYNHENKAVNVSCSHDITVRGCKLRENFCGIRLRNSISISIEECNIIENIVGLAIDGSSDNTITNCDILDNKGYGIYISDFVFPSLNNLIHHNNIIGNGENAYDECGNIWNTSIGNYWGDYTGTDADGDGMGDEAYPIYGGSEDDRPLIYQITTPSLFVWVDDDYNVATPGWKIDHFDDVQEAIDNLSEGGKCYVYPGSYNGCAIEKGITLIGEHGAVINSDNDGIFINADNVDVRGFSISANNNGIKIQNSNNANIIDCNAGYGIFGLYAVNSFNCNIENSSFYENIKGIYLFNSAGLKISGNAIYNNSYFGIEISHGSTNNQISDCHIENNGNYGTYITQNSNGNMIYHNNFINNTAYDICSNEWGSAYDYVLGNYWSDYGGADTNMDGMGDTAYLINGGEMDAYPLICPIENPPSFVWVNPLFSELFPGWGLDHFISISEAVGIVNEGGDCFVFPGTYKENIMINKKLTLSGARKKDTIVEGNGMAAFTVMGNDVEIHDFGIRNCWNDVGLSILGSNAGIFDCDVYDNYYGIYVHAVNATVEDCIIRDNSFTGVTADSMQHSEIKNCSIYGNNNGMVFSYSLYNVIRDNNVSGNSVHGLKLQEFSNNNTILYNSFENNIYGLYANQSLDNDIYLNNFLNNTVHAYDSGMDNWDSGSIGNYWDDQEFEDNDFNGIGDSSYNIPGGINVDHYPLIRMVGLPVAYFTYIPSGGIDTWTEISFVDMSVDLDGNIVSWTWDFGDGNTTIINEINEKANKWALICVSANDLLYPNSDGFPAQGLQAYYTLKAHGYRDDHIIFMLWHDNDNNISIYGGHNDLLGPPPQIGGPNIPPQIDYSHASSLPEGVNNWYELLHYKINVLASSVGPNDDILIYLVNHGNYSDETNKAVFCFEDGSSDLPEDIFDSWVDTINCKRLTILVDTCYSGDFIDASSDPGFDSGIDNETNRILISESGHCAGWSYTSSTEDNWAGSFFFHPFFEKIDEGKSIREAYDYAVSYIPSGEIKNVSELQDSQLIDNMGDSNAYTFLPSEGQNPYKIFHSYSDDGIYNVTLEIIDNDGNNGTVSHEIHVANVPPIANFSWIPPDPTDMDTVHFIDNSDDPDGFVVNWSWNFGDGNISYGDNTTHTYAGSDTYIVTLTVKDDDGDSSTIQKEIFVANDPPVANFSYSPLTPSTADIIHFNDTSIDADGVVVNWTWNFGDGNISYVQNPGHSYADNGTYAVILIVIDNDNGIDSVTKHINISNVPPVAGYSFSPSSPKDVDVIHFSDESYDTDGSVVLWYWEFGDGQTSTAQNPIHTYSDDGTYMINLTVTDDDGASGTITYNVFVRNAPPMADFYYVPPSPYDLDNVSFYDSSGDADGHIVSYSWEFGDGNTSDEKNPLHMYTNNGIYTVKLTVTDDDGASTTVSHSILIANLPPVADFSYSPENNITDLDEILFTDNSSDSDGSIANYTWDFGDGNYSYEQNPTHKYADNGVYTVTLMVTDNDGSSISIAKEMEVLNAKPIAKFSYKPEKPQERKYISFEDLSTDADGIIVNATWNFGDGFVQEDGKLLSHKYNKKGDYIVTLTVTDDDGESSSTRTTITVKAKEETSGFDFVMLVAAVGILFIMWKSKRGIWRKR